MIQDTLMALRVGYPSLIPDTVTLVKRAAGDQSEFDWYPVMATGLPPPVSCAGSARPTGSPLMPVTTRLPVGSLPPATVDWLLTMLEIVSRGVSVVVCRLPSDAV